MIAFHHERGSFWLRLKLFFTLGKTDPQSPTGNPTTPKPKRRSHRTTAFFEMP
ncbi:MAG: hypothetical protein HOP33_12715 [Verrucomicrobia bacterium]|nr:hypothetical protein [Verrucomicrobiota bacterium]